MSHKKPTPSAPSTASAKASIGSAGRGHTIAFVTTLVLSLATAIGAAAWLIGAQEYTGMTTTTMPGAQATASSAATPATSGTPGTRAAAAAPATSAAQPAMTTVQPPSTPSAAGQRAFIDPVTGQLRQPEHDELAAIAAAEAAAARRLARTATANAAPEFFGPDGSIGAVVPEDLHTFAVATRGADGRIVIEHAQGAKNAARLVKANGAKNPQAPVSRAQKEDRNDR